MHKIITWDEFIDQYKPVQNHLDSQAALEGQMFETYGEELDFVGKTRAINPRTVLTYLDSGEGFPILVNGYCFVNRIGYVITEVPLEEGMSLEVIDE